MPHVFQHRSTLWAGDQTTLTSLRDLGFVDLQSGPLIHTLAGPSPDFELGAYAVGGTAPLSVRIEIGTGQAGVAPTLVHAETAGGKAMVLVTGTGGTGILGRWIDAEGRYGASFDPTAGADVPSTLGPLAVAVVGGATHVYGLRPDSRVPMHWQMNEAGAMTLRDAGTAGAAGATDLAVAGSRLVVGGGDPLLEIHRIGADGALTSTGGLEAEDNPGMSGPITVEFMEVAGITYVVAGAADSGTLSVFRVTGTGGLVLTDHVLDTLDTRFAGVVEIATAEVGDGAYLAAGGSDSGVSLFRLLPGGRLLHLGAQEDTTDSSMDGLAAMDLNDDGTGGLLLATSGLRDPGLSIFRHAAATGAVVIAPPAGGQAQGTADDDIVMDDGGSDTLVGGAGADIFVLKSDGRDDIVADFEIARDRLDLSGWAFLRGPSQLEFFERADGVTIRYQGFTGTETLHVLSRDGTPIATDEIAAAIMTGPDRFLPSWFDDPGPTPLDLHGTEESDTLTGGAGDDRIHGYAGADLLVGDDGHDLIEAGLGDDTIRGGDGDDTVHGGDGRDVIEGGPGDDSLFGDAGFDTILGGDGADRIDGGAGSDLLDGGAGDDTLDGGTEDDTLQGGAGHDVLYGGDGADLLSGGDGDDTIYGGAGADTLDGGGGRNLLDGGGGDDVFVFRAGGVASTGDPGPGIDALHWHAAPWGDEAIG